MTAVPRGPFRGWIIVAIALLVMTLVFGARFSMGLFLPWMPEALGTSAGSISLAFAGSTLLAGASQPLVGMLADRWGPDRVLTTGIVLTGVSLVGTGLATSLWQVMLFMGLLSGLAFAGVNLVIMSALLTRWFRRHRGRALGAVTVGTKVGLLVVVPAAGAAIAAWGWRTALVLLGLSILALAPLTWAYMVSDPERLGLRPDGDSGPPPAGPAGPAREPETRIPLALIVRTPAFWLLTLSLFSNGFMMNLVYLHLPSFVLHHGHGTFLATTTLAVMGATGIVGNLLTTSLSDSLGRRLVLGVLYAARALSTLLIVVHPEPAAIYVFAVVFGLLGYGAVAITSALTADIFGRHSQGGAFGLIYVTHQIGAAAGVLAGGLSVDLTGTYTTALLLGSAVSLVSVPLIAIVPTTTRLPARHAGRAGG
jgi:sugar phosphate permease